MRTEYLGLSFQDAMPGGKIKKPLVVCLKPIIDAQRPVWSLAHAGKRKKYTAKDKKEVGFHIMWVLKLVICDGWCTLHPRKLLQHD